MTTDIMQLKQEIKEGTFQIYKHKDNKIYLRDMETEECIILYDLKENLQTIANDVEEKMTYMCGCRNCIETMKAIIVRNFKPRKSQCEQCSNFDECSKKQGR